MWDIGAFLDALKRWGAKQEGMVAIALVGSFARGTARADSDIDVVIITQTPQPYLQHDDWLTHFGVIETLQDEDWGMVQSRRVFYADGAEVEFGITTPPWLAVDPVDAGTRRVIADGALIILDPKGLLAELIQVVLDDSTSA